MRERLHGWKARYDVIFFLGPRLTSGVQVELHLCKYDGAPVGKKNTQY